MYSKSEHQIVFKTIRENAGFIMHCPEEVARHGRTLCSVKILITLSLLSVVLNKNSDNRSFCVLLRKKAAPFLQKGAVFQNGAPREPFQFPFFECKISHNETNKDKLFIMSRSKDDCKESV